MSTIRDRLNRFFSPIQTLSPGIYHFQSPPEDPRNYRLHLRVEVDGSGVLILNASTVLHLNQTATEYAYYLVQNLPPEKAARQMAARYHVEPEQARQDYLDFIARIQALINTPDLDPVTFLDLDRQAPFSRRISAPYRLDCALTYRLPAGELAESAPVERVKHELSTAEWESILDKAWQAGIPQIVFTGGEPTLREDLAELIAHAEKNGQVTGLLSSGLRFTDPDYLNTLLQTGLDHLLMVLEPEDEKTWLALENVLAADLAVAVHLTLTPTGLEPTLRLLERLEALGVRAVSLSASDRSLDQELHTARNKAAELHLELVWNLPAPYSTHNPVALEVAAYSDSSGAGRAWLYVEPDGDVLPAQGVNTPIGNFLSDPWEKIWKK